VCLLCKLSGRFAVEIFIESLARSTAEQLNDQNQGFRTACFAVRGLHSTKDGEIMAEEKTISIRTALMPAYCKDFHCLAENCRDSCCKDWRIEFDKNDFLRLRRLDAPKEFKPRLDSAVKRLRSGPGHGTLFGHFQLEDGNCPLLEKCGLCSLQLNCGGEALPEVCRVFPRISCYTAAAREHCLTLGCEAVHKLLNGKIVKKEKIT